MDTEPLTGLMGSSYKSKSLVDSYTNSHWLTHTPITDEYFMINLNSIIHVPHIIIC